jgi:NADPH:quinone reductase-like Zn-dependent oxidoreductase
MGLRTLNVVRRADSVTPLKDAGADVVLVEGGDLTDQAAEAIGDAPLELIIDAVAGEPVAKLVSLLKAGGPIVSYTARNRQPLSIPIVDLIFRGLSVHGYWLNRWLDSTPQETIVRTYRELADLVRNGTLAAPVEATYALPDYREAIGHAARNDRHGKVLFTFQ